MFLFNFNNAEKPDNLNESEAPNNACSEDESITANCNYIHLDSLKFEIDHDKVKTLNCGNYEIKYITQNSFLSSSLESQECSALNSDLIPGLYEGGLKVWECSVDLVNFLSAENLLHSGDTVLELGCGVGLPGLLLYLCGASVTFQDYNSEVLELVTAPNVVLNSIEKDVKKICDCCQFLCGDWEEIHRNFFLCNQKKKEYDVIVTSETIYNKSNQKKLLKLMKSAIKPDGVIYLASKVHYFGVGGGIAEFEELLKEDNSFDFSTVFQISEGVERRILKLAFKK